MFQTMALGWNPSPIAPSTAEFLSSKEFTQQRVIHRLLLGERVDVPERQGLPLGVRVVHSILSAVRWPGFDFTYLFITDDPDTKATVTLKSRDDIATSLIRSL